MLVEPDFRLAAEEVEQRSASLEELRARVLAALAANPQVLARVLGGPSSPGHQVIGPADAVALPSEPARPEQHAAGDGPRYSSSSPTQVSAQGADQRPDPQRAGEVHRNTRAYDLPKSI